MQGEASTRLGFTDYFRVEPAWAKLLGAVLLGAVLLAPVPARLKEWAYAAFAITLGSALIAHLSIGFGRSEDRVLNTPSCFLARSPLGCTVSTSRRARSSQVTRTNSSPGRILCSPSRNGSGHALREVELTEASSSKE